MSHKTPEEEIYIDKIAIAKGDRYKVLTTDTDPNYRVAVKDGQLFIWMWHEFSDPQEIGEFVNKNRPDIAELCKTGLNPVNPIKYSPWIRLPIEMFSEDSEVQIALRTVNSETV